MPGRGKRHRKRNESSLLRPSHTSPPLATLLNCLQTQEWALAEISSLVLLTRNNDLLQTSKLRGGLLHSNMTSKWPFPVFLLSYYWPYSSSSKVLCQFNFYLPLKHWRKTLRFIFFSFTHNLGDPIYLFQLPCLYRWLSIANVVQISHL